MSKRVSKKWDMTPSDVAKRSVPAAKSFDMTDVDPCVPKVVPMCEVESALGREEEGEGVGREEVRRQLQLVMINKKRENSSTEVW